MAGGGVDDLHTVWRDEWLGEEQTIRFNALLPIIEIMT